MTMPDLSTKFDKLDRTVTNLVETVNVLSEKMDAGFARADENLEKLAIMVARGFEETNKQFYSLENKLETEVTRLDIRLDQMAPNFEIKDLNKRVNKLEENLNVT